MPRLRHGRHVLRNIIRNEIHERGRKMKNYIRVLCLTIALLCAVFCVACGDKDGKDSEKNGSSEFDKFYIVYNGVTVKLGDKADGVIAALGEAQSRTEIGDCGGLGAQVKYTYSSFDLYVLESKTDGNIIDQITFRDDIVSTPEGVCIGASVADTKAKLGEPTTSTDKALLYTDGKYTLKVSISGDIVTDINYITN